MLCLSCKFQFPLRLRYQVFDHNRGPHHRDCRVGKTLLKLPPPAAPETQKTNPRWRMEGLSGSLGIIFWGLRPHIPELWSLGLRKRNTSLRIDDPLMDSSGCPKTPFTQSPLPVGDVRWPTKVVAPDSSTTCPPSVTQSGSGFCSNICSSHLSSSRGNSSSGSNCGNSSHSVKRSFMHVQTEVWQSNGA
uniref:HDC12271 n=1 Tax=Drosophila melanogaster TaxID=7227 RepID=Q6IKJ7_DROME|nr:TPA_inf: HDC12271 [Drosophila melanogaster]